MGGWAIQEMGRAEVDGVVVGCPFRQPWTHQERVENENRG